MQYYAM